MKIKFWKALFALTLLILPASCVQDNPNPNGDSLFPDRPVNYLTDVAGVVKNPDVVNARLKEIHEKDRLSLVVVTLPTIRGHAMNEVAMEIGRKWLVATKNDTIGAAVRNTGGVILLVTDIRECFVAPATGSEGYMTDSRSGAACDNAASYFKAGNFGEGFLSIANTFDGYHRGEVVGAEDASTESPEDHTLMIIIIVVVIIVVIAIVITGVLGGSGGGYSSSGSSEGGFFSGDSSPSTGGDGGGVGGDSGSFDGGGAGGSY